MSFPARLSGAATRLASRLSRPLFIDAGGDHRDAIFVAGSERSGTTWLADLINYQRRFRLVFEPFWGLRVPACSGFGAQQYLRPWDASPEYLEPARRILRGDLRNPWSDRYHRAYFSRRRIVKDVRANLLLKWLRENFPEMPIVFILRHPCAVASSQELAKHRFGDLEAHFLSQPDLVEDFLAPYLDAIRGAKTPFEQRIFRWCIQNMVPLRQFEHWEIQVVFYEELCARPGETLRPVLDAVNVSADVGAVDFHQPSPVSRKDSAVVTGGDLVEKWREFVTPAEVGRAVEILELFGLDDLYGAGSMPRSESLGGVMGRRCAAG